MKRIDILCKHKYHLLMLISLYRRVRLGLVYIMIVILDSRILRNKLRRLLKEEENVYYLYFRLVELKNYYLFWMNSGMRISNN